MNGNRRERRDKTSIPIPTVGEIGFLRASVTLITAFYYLILTIPTI
jgi:hypothetical protein